LTRRGGHDGRRDPIGRFEREGLRRERLSTALAPQHKQLLDQLAAELEMRPCDVLERLLTTQQCRDVLRRQVEAERRQRALLGDPDPLGTAVLQLCQQHGATWPRGAAQRLALAYGVTRQAISSRKQAALAKN
jgi:hypothetical protein